MSVKLIQKSLDFIQKATANENNLKKKVVKLMYIQMEMIKDKFLKKKKIKFLLV